MESKNGQEIWAGISADWMLKMREMEMSFSLLLGRVWNHILSLPFPTYRIPVTDSGVFSDPVLDSDPLGTLRTPPT